MTVLDQSSLQDTPSVQLVRPGDAFAHGQSRDITATSPTANANTALNTAHGEDTFVGGVLPHNIDIEQALIAALMRDNTLLDELHGVVTEADFFHPWHQKIFDLIVRQVGRGSIVRAETLQSTAHLWAPQAEKSVAIEYLRRLAANAVVLSSVRKIGLIVADYRRRRELINLCDDVKQEAIERLDLEIESLIEVNESKLYQIAGSLVEQRLSTFGVVSTQALNTARKSRDRNSQLIGIATGFTKIDEVLGGLQRNDLVVLAGRPSMGKTALATNICYNAAWLRAQSLLKSPQLDSDDTNHQGGRVLLISMEMSSEQLATRIIAEQSRIPSTRIRRGNLDDNEFAKIVRTTHDMSDLPLVIDDSPALSIGQLRQRIRRTLRRHGLDLVVIDYLQLMRSDKHRMSEGRVMEITQITQGLKSLAKEFNVPILVLSQLSRQTEMREDKRPQLSDLRDSGSIEQDADVVMFIFREEYYMQRRRPTRGDNESEEDYLDRLKMFEASLAEVRNLAEVNIAKHRNGPVSMVQLHFDGNLTRFDNIDETHQSQYPERNYQEHGKW